MAFAAAFDSGAFSVSAFSPAAFAFGVIDSESGGRSNTYLGPNIRRRTKKEAYREREALRLTIEGIEQAAQKIVEKTPIKEATNALAVDSGKIDYYSRRDIADLTKLLMLELQVTVQMPDYTRAIEIAIAAHQRNRDEEDALLMMLM